jgi:hypothetical protein
VVLRCLGAFHGRNPGMGWLFAVALGLQERRRATVYRALVPMALGHALSITAVLVVVGGIQVVVSEGIVHSVSAAVLGAFGLYRLIRSWHPRWVGTRMDCKDLVLYLLSAPLTMPLVCRHIKSFRRASSGGEAMARRRKEERRAGIASRGM